MAAPKILTTMLSSRLTIKISKIRTTLWRQGNNAFHTASVKFSTPKKEIDWKATKEKFLKMDPDDKRTHYKSKGNLLTLDSIRTWSGYYDKKKIDLYKGEKKWAVSHPINSRVSIGKGDITMMEIDAVVNSTSSDLTGTGGAADQAIHNAAGPDLLEECKSLRGCEIGKAKITGGYRLPAKYIIHTVGPKGEIPAKLSACYVSCLSLMKIHRLKTIAFPCISTGSNGYPPEKAVHIALHTVRKFLQYNPDDIQRVIFCLYKLEDLKAYEDAMQIYFPME